MDYLLIALMWTGYCALHSFLISISFTNLMMRILKEYYAFYRLFYVAISLVLLIPLINYSVQTEGGAIITYSLPFTIIRYVLTAVSLLIFIKAFFFDYDFLTFFGIRQLLEFGKKKSQQQSKETLMSLGSPKKMKIYDGSMWPLKNKLVSHEIRKEGLLGIVRHPMYFGLMLYVWCQTTTLMDLMVNIILTIYIIIGTYLEEKKLVLEFGDTYINYQHEVPMLIPFTKAKG